MNNNHKKFFMNSEEQREAVLEKLKEKNGLSKESLFKLVGGAFGDVVKGTWFEYVDPAWPESTKPKN